MPPIRARLTYYCDGALDPQGRGTGVAVVVRNTAGQIVDAVSAHCAAMTCNEAEYEALLLGLELARMRGRRGEAVLFVIDSQIVVGQLAGHFAVHDPRLAQLHGRALALLARLPDATLLHVPRAHNRLADALAGEALMARLGVTLPGTQR